VNRGRPVLNQPKSRDSDGLVLTKSCLASGDENVRSLAYLDIFTRLFQPFLATHFDSIAIYEITGIPCPLSLVKKFNCCCLELSIGVCLDESM